MILNLDFALPAICLLQNDDSYILPVLLRFDGQPEVDEEVSLNCVSVAHNLISNIEHRNLSPFV